MRKSKVTPWGERSPEDRVEQAAALVSELAKTLADPPKRAVWKSRTSAPTFLNDDPEDVGRRFLWDRLRRSGGEPSGWGVELHRKGSQVTVDVEPEFGPHTEEVEAWTLEHDELLCRAPDGCLVEPRRALAYHFRKAHTFNVDEHHFQVEAAQRRAAEARVDAARARVEEERQQTLRRIETERERVRKEVADEVAKGLLKDALADIDDALDDL